MLTLGVPVICICSFNEPEAVLPQLLIALSTSMTLPESRHNTGHHSAPQGLCQPGVDGIQEIRHSSCWEGLSEVKQHPLSNRAGRSQLSLDAGEGLTAGWLLDEGFRYCAAILDVSSVLFRERLKTHLENPLQMSCIHLR